MRVLVTNDDGVHAPGIAHLARAVAAADGGIHDVVVVAPMENHSGASASIGRIYESERVGYHRVTMNTAPDILAYGVDASPALAALLGYFGGALGPRPDVVLSGVNHGANVGRSILHSGTVGAALSAAQLDAQCLAVSLRYGTPPVPWESATTLAVACLEPLAASAPGTVLNLNVPALPLTRIAGLRAACIGYETMVSGARAGDGTRDVSGGGDTGEGDGAGDGGTLALMIGDAIPELVRHGTRVGGGSDGATGRESDTALMAAGYATLTAITGVREDRTPGADATIEAALGNAADVMRRLSVEPSVRAW